MRERKFRKPRSPKRVFLVICEGETEKTYVETLKHHFRLPITIKYKVVGNKINNRLLAQFINELGVDKDDYKVFFIYDGDVENIVEKLRPLQGELIISNPCIELWYLLHNKDFFGPSNPEDILKSLIKSSQEWTGYEKGRLSVRQKDIVLGNYENARNRAINLRWPENPSTNMYEFIESLKNEKKR